MKERIYMFGGGSVALVLIALGFFTYSGMMPISPEHVSTEGASETSIPDAPVTPSPTTAEERIRVTEPTPGMHAVSPLVVLGEARGTWYFEASFPIELVDANGVVLAQTPAQATGDWMTENFVPFTATLTWSATSTVATSGVLILKRDNPSGMPEYDASISIPLVFEK